MSIPKCKSSNGIEFNGFTRNNGFILSNTRPNPSVPASTSGVFILPSKCTLEQIEYPITGVNGYVFYGTAITELIIPSTITSIDGAAFEGMKYLERADLSLAKVSEIGGYTLADNVKLKYVLFPPNLKSLESHVFYRCYSLEALTFPKSLKTISNEAFLEVTTLKTIIFCGFSDIYQTLPDSVEYVYVSDSYSDSKFCGISVKKGYQYYSNCLHETFKKGNIAIVHNQFITCILFSIIITI